MAPHNRAFKAPQGDRPLRSPSPPNAFIEPLSPARLMPVESTFDQPETTTHPTFVQSAFQASLPKPKHPASIKKSRHTRTPSTIDTLAEAALAIIPTIPPGEHEILESNGPKFGHRSHHSYGGGGEPPHKRARSELFPSPYADPAPSRPATSYTPHAWQQGYKSRVEEAALLLNFQSGGWPVTSNPNAPIQSPLTPRPHANSFPQASNHARLHEPGHLSLLPPFTPHSSHSPQVNFSASETQRQVLNGHHREDGEANGLRRYSAPQGSSDTHSATMERSSLMEHGGHAMLDRDSTQTPGPSESLPDAPKRRGWPKGKPRGAGTRKTFGEKAVQRRSHPKKPSDPRGRKTKSARKPTTPIDETARRKSMSDGLVFGEEQRGDEVAQATERSLSVPRDVDMIIREASPLKTARRKAPVVPETICASCAIFRESATSRGELDEWISCNGCKNWLHIDCAGFKKAHEVRDVDKFFCTACEPTHGKTTFVRKSARAHASVDYKELQRGVLKTSEESVEHHYIQPIKDGTFEFEPEYFPRLRPEMVTQDFFEKSGTFTEPICIPAEWNPRPWAQEEQQSSRINVAEPSEDGAEVLNNHLPEDFEYDALPDQGQDRLEMVIPENLTVRQVCNLVGMDMPLDVIDVKTQNSGAKWTLGRWADYYEETLEAKTIRNVISLEVSQTRLGRLLQRPKIVRDIDLQDDVWPQDEKDRGRWPKVQFYCLMSVADSYTDFHIDFGGSSVYYHILRGKKTFFFIPPKAKHLKAYEEWNNNPQQNYTFLPHITKECYRVDLSQGDTMLIPSGWIHAVWTPEDSLVIGGNFLNRTAYKNQFKVVDIEKANETPMKFRYPYFQKIMWYTAIKYLKDDPLPPTVCQMFYEGKRYERKHPIWADFDGTIAEKDGSVGASNFRYYCQAEVDGLPDLVNYIFRTVMLVMGRLEGVSQDRMKRVNASIPKGYGEPLDVAKTFALWVAWKRGNEDPPAWAHPDAVLPNSKEEGPPKKLSERKLRELERREAIAAYRVAPDRQSARVMSKNAALANGAHTSTIATPDGIPSPASAQHQFHPQQASDHQQPSSMATSTSPGNLAATFIMSGLSGQQHLSTPKTSVLGPKRVACDACRKRRIRCKHKDMVIQTTPDGLPSLNGAAFHSADLPDLHENIMVTPTKGQDQVNFVNTMVNGDSALSQRMPNGTPDVQNRGPDGSGPFPGTNAYVNAHIPMAMNGVAIFGEPAKRGRSKACFECRKSKRRCIHDEHGNVDPINAAETPTMRTSNGIKKRPFGEVESPVPIQRKQRPSNEDSHILNLQSHMLPQTNGHNGLEHQPIQQPQQQNLAPAIDPNLFTMYTEAHNDFTSNGPYPTSTAASTYHQPATYQLPSLEQIANEVLVDMTGPDPPEQPSDQQGLNGHGQQTLPLQNGKAGNNGKVNGVTPHVASERRNAHSTEQPLTNGHSDHDNHVKTESLSNGFGTHDMQSSALAAAEESERYARLASFIAEAV